jgi:hypothetical protein
MTDLVATKSNLPEILTSLLPAVVRPTTQVLDIPKAVKVTAKIASAVATLKIGVVDTTPLTVVERRALTPEEIDQLSVERDEIDALEKYITARKEAHRAMVFNHFDVVDADPEAEVDGKGHLLLAAEVAAQGGSKKFVRQISKGSPVVTADALDGVANAGDIEGFDHDAYLACTTPIRVLDEEKTLIQMRTNPAVVEALRLAVKPGGVSGSLYHRSA